MVARGIFGYLLISISKLVVIICRVPVRSKIPVLTLGVVLGFGIRECGSLERGRERHKIVAFLVPY